MLVSETDQDIIREHIKNNIDLYLGKNVAIFGVSMYARFIRDELRAHTIEITALIDNSVEKIGKTCLNVHVYSPEEYISKYRKSIVIVCSIYYYEMAEQLLALGFNKTNISIIPINDSYNNRYDDSMDAMNIAMFNVKAGYLKYCEIKEAYSENCRLMLCPYPGTGDIYMACTYMEAYCSKNNISNYVMVLGGQSCRKVAEIFGVTNIEVLSDEDRENMLKAWVFFGDDFMPLKPLLFWGWRTKRCISFDKHKNVTFNEHFLYDVFGLDKTAHRTFPQKNSNKYAVDFAEENKLKKNKTVILAPYAGSFKSEMATSEWESIAALLKRKGYVVCTNCNGTTEYPIYGTIPVFFPYSEAIAIIEYAGGFIGLRSGLCDVISSADCKMVILYESGFNAARESYFGLKKMGLNKDAIELNIGEDDIVAQINNIFG